MQGTWYSLDNAGLKLKLYNRIKCACMHIKQDLHLAGI